MPFSSYDRLPSINHIFGSSGGRAGHPLNVAYVHRTSGQALSLRWFAKSTDPITEVYLLIDDFVGTLANCLMKAQIYNEDSASSTRPGTTLRASSTACTLPSAVDRWAKFTFGTPYSPSAIGEILHIVISSDAIAPATDYASPVITTDTAFPISVPNLTGYSTVDGFATNGTAQSETCCIIKQGSYYQGKTISASSSTWPTSTRKRGIVITPPCDLKVSAIIWDQPSVNYNGFQIFDNVTGPGGTPLYSWALGSDANQSRDEIIGSKQFTPVLLTGGQTYKAVLTMAANLTTPSYRSVEGYSDYPAVFDELVDGFNICPACIDDGAGGWTVYNDRCMWMTMVIDEFVLPSGSAGILPNSNLRGNLQ